MYFKICYDTNIYCVTIGDYDKFIFENKFSEMGYYIYNSLCGKSKFEKGTLDGIYYILKKEFLKVSVINYI